MQLIARAPDTGRSSSHLSSPRTARVAKAESSRGGGKRTGLSASHAATTTPCLALRFQTGSRTSGVDAHRVHTLQGCECREKTHRLKCNPVEVMATVLSRRRPTCCWSKTAVAKEPRARRSGDPRAVPNDGSALGADPRPGLNGGTERTVACQPSPAVTRQNAQGARRRSSSTAAVVGIWPVLSVRPDDDRLELGQSRW